MLRLDPLSDAVTILESFEYHGVILSNNQALLEVEW